MSIWLCKYSRDGMLKMHTQLEAIDEEDAKYQLINDFGLTEEEIIDIREILP